MRGRRGPELACGSMDELAREVSDLSAAVVYMQLAPMASGQEVATIFSDLESIRSSLLYTLRLKMSCWTQLPRVLIGIAHWDPELAREAGARALRLYEFGQQSRSDSRHSEHPVSKKFCGAGADALRPQLLGFVSGRDLFSDQCAALRDAVSRLALASVSERSVERKHRMVSLALERSFAALVPVLSLAERQKDIDAMLAEGDERLNELAGCGEFVCVSPSF